MNKSIDIGDVAQKTSHLFVFNVLFPDLVPFYSEDSSYSSVVEDCELAEIILSEIPRLASPKEGIEGTGDINLRFNPFVDVFVVKEMRRTPYNL